MIRHGETEVPKISG
jgi:hypothetical protein